MINFPKKQKKERLSVSIAPDLAEWVRETAKNNDCTISAVVEAALRHAKAQDMSNKMIEAILEK